MSTPLALEVAQESLRALSADYEVLAPLGGGGQGSVWLSRDRQDPTGGELAIKLIPAELSPQAQGSAGGNEIAAWRSLAELGNGVAAGLVPVRRLLLGDDGSVAVIMPRYPSSLSAWSRSQAVLSTRVLVGLVTDLEHGLQQLHRLDLVHRDLKAGNCLIEFTDTGPRLRIGDYGCTLPRGAFGRMVTPDLPIDLDQPATPADDLRSLALLLCSLISGRSLAAVSNGAEGSKRQPHAGALQTAREAGRVADADDSWYQRVMERVIWPLDRGELQLGEIAAALSSCSRPPQAGRSLAAPLVAAVLSAALAFALGWLLSNDGAATDSPLSTGPLSTHQQTQVNDIQRYFRAVDHGIDGFEAGWEQAWSLLTPQRQRALGNGPADLKASIAGSGSHRLTGLIPLAGDSISAEWLVVVVVRERIPSNPLHLWLAAGADRRLGDWYAHFPDPERLAEWLSEEYTLEVEMKPDETDLVKQHLSNRSLTQLLDPRLLRPLRQGIDRELPARGQVASWTAVEVLRLRMLASDDGWRIDQVDSEAVAPVHH